MTDGTARDSGGEYLHTIDDAENDAAAARLRAMGMSYREIAKQQGIGHATAHRRVQNALKAVPAAAVNELRATSEERINMLIARAMAIATTRHPMVSHGRLIPDQWDVRPNLMAIRELRMLDSELRVLYGVNAPIKHEVKVSDSLTAEIEMLAQQLGIGIDSVNVDDRGPVGA